MPATEEYWRNLSQMHRLFAWSSVALFAATIWMMAADHDDEWRVFQKEFQRRAANKLREKEQEAKTAEFEKTSAALKQAYDTATQNLKQQHADIAKLEATLSKIEADFARIDRGTKFKRAQRDVDRANYDLAVRDNLPKADLQRLKKIFDTSEEVVKKSELELQRVTTARYAPATA